MTAFLESWGTGVSRMVEACKAVGLPEPEYGADGLFVWIIFKRPNAGANSDTDLDTKNNRMYKKGHRKGHVNDHFCDLFYDPFCGVYRQIVHIINPVYILSVWFITS